MTVFINQFPSFVEVIGFSEGNSLVYIKGKLNEFGQHDVLEIPREAFELIFAPLEVFTTNPQTEE